MRPEHYELRASGMMRGGREIPKSQKAKQTRGFNAALRRARYMVHEVEGAPGRGSM